jgi:ribosomal protein L12E/L44/L45/RPP1/RPP2
MSDAKPFAFSQFVPGFDFLQSLAKGASGGASAVPGMPSLSSWVAPTLSVEEVDKRIQELKTVQYWLEQNGHALKATIQALEVQKMTLSTLRGMNLRMEDLANAFTRSAAPPPAPAAPAPQAYAPEPQPEPEAVEPEEAEEPEEPAEVPAPRRGGKAKASNGPAAPDAAGGVVDPLQWWGALTQQFQQIASSALQDASQLKMPAVAQPIADAMGGAMSGAAARPAARKTGASAKKAPAAAKKTTARKRTRAR